MKNLRKSFKSKNDKRFKYFLICGILLSLFVFVCSLLFGVVNFKISDLFNNDLNSFNRAIILYSRLPRTIAGFMSGSALAVSGLILQNILANKLASPTIIGINAAAGLGVTVVSVLFIRVSGILISLGSFVFSMLTILLISAFSIKNNFSKTTIILIGVAVNSILNSINEAISILSPDVAILSSEFRMGGFSSVSYSRLIPASILIIISFIILFTLLNELEIASLGELSAKSVGLNISLYRIIFMILAALLASSAVSFAGLLPFVGLIVPHILRTIFDDDISHLLPLSIVYGGLFVMIMDFINRLIFMPYEVPVGILMMLVGGSLFIYIVYRYKGGHLNV